MSNTSTIVKRGFFNHCPRCGEGKLLRAYITPNLHCEHCALDFEPLRADDGPAWATILITGHLSMPFVFWLLEYKTLSTHATIAILIALVLGMSAVILPRAKSIFMAVIWMTQQKTRPD